MPEYGEFCVSTRPQMALCLVVEDHMTSDGCVSLIKSTRYMRIYESMESMESVECSEYITVSRMRGE